jgi:uncharacterized surface protein with fasciclin (FAS1) repeats
MKKVLFSAIAVLSLAFAFISCEKDDDKVKTPETVVAVALADTSFNTLVAALTKADLVTTLQGAGPFTVFAPTNKAFKTFLAAAGYAKVEDVPVNVLKQILLNHVVSGSVKSTALTNGYVKTLATFGATTNNLSLLVDITSGVKLNKTVKVATADVLAKNGVVHVVDAVIGLPSIVAHAANNGAFSTLVSALTRADLGVDYLALLSTDGPFTVFAPTNDAFAALLTEKGFANLAAIPKDLLNKVLQYHVLAGAVRSTDLVNDSQPATYGGQKVTIKTTGGATITDANSRVSKIIIVDVTGTNGVVHAIDKVLLPI